MTKLLGPPYKSLCVNKADTDLKYFDHYTEKHCFYECSVEIIGPTLHQGHSDWTKNDQVIYNKDFESKKPPSVDVELRSSQLKWSFRYAVLSITQNVYHQRFGVTDNFVIKISVKAKLYFRLSISITIDAELKPRNQRNRLNTNVYQLAIQ